MFSRFFASTYHCAVVYAWTAYIGYDFEYWTCPEMYEWVLYHADEIERDAEGAICNAIMTCRFRVNEPVIELDNGVTNKMDYDLTFNVTEVMYWGSKGLVFYVQELEEIWHISSIEHFYDMADAAEDACIEYHRDNFWAQY